MAKRIRYRYRFQVTQKAAAVPSPPVQSPRNGAATVAAWASAVAAIASVLVAALVAYVQADSGRNTTDQIDLLNRYIGVSARAAKDSATSANSFSNAAGTMSKDVHTATNTLQVAVTALKQSADAAGQSVTSQLDQLQAEQRAWLFPSGLDYEPADIDPTKLAFKITLSNSGRTPAKGVELRTLFIYNDRETYTPEEVHAYIEELRKPKTSEIQTFKLSDYPPTIGNPQPNVDGVMFISADAVKATNIDFFGMLSYRDVFGAVHRTFFGYTRKKGPNSPANAIEFEFE